MSICVSMHSRTTWPSRINFDIFHCYLAGCTVDEGVDYLKSILLPDGRRKSCGTPSLSASTSSPVPSLPPSHVSSNESPSPEKGGEANGEKTAAPPRNAPPGEFLDDAKPEASEQQQIPPSRRKRKTQPRAERHAHAHHAHTLPNRQRGTPTRRRSSHAKCTHDSDGFCKYCGGGAEDWLLNSLEEGFPSLATLAVAAGYAQAQSLSDPRDLLHRKKAPHRHQHAHGSHAEATSCRKHVVDSFPPENPFMLGLSRNVYFNYREYRAYLFKLEQEAAVESAGQDRSFASVGATTLTELLLEEVEEQYDFYNYLTKAMKHALSTPYVFLSSNYLPIPISDRRRLVELYYAVDPVVFRYYFGTKTTHFEPATGTEEDRKGRGLFQRGGAPGEGKDLERMAAHLAQIPPASLQRQRENIRRVCASLIAIYHGKDHAIVPPGVSVLAAVKRCLGVPDPLAFHYGAAVFGSYHGLRGRLSDRLPGYDEVCALCSAVMSLWCDDSLLFLDPAFSAGVSRLAGLLEEHRVLAELHQGVFNEAMRTRWQVQLDEVQRAVMPNSAGEKAAASASLAGSPASSSPTAAAGAFSQAAGDPPGPAGDPAFSRRFVLEFPQTMRHLARMMACIGGGRSINDALEVFYHRIFAALEALGAQEGGGGGAGSPLAKSAASQGSPRSPRPSPRPRGRARSASPASKRARTPPGEEEKEEESAALAPPPTAAPRSREDARKRGAGRSDAGTAWKSKPRLSSCAVGLPKSMSMPHFGEGFSNRRGSPEKGPREVRKAESVGERPPRTRTSPALRGGEKVDAKGGSRGGEDWGSTPGASVGAVNGSQALDACPAESVVAKAPDKHCLRELLVFMSELPNVWRQLSSVTADDHAQCDEAFNSFLMVLKVITQILMAAEDFR